VQWHLQIVSRSPEETRILGAALAPLLVPGDVISLSGDLGAGKTVFVQGLATALGVDGQVTSPTFTIVHEYKGRYPILHMDLYRLNSFQEVLDLGFEELLDPSAVMLVEWGEAVAPLLPRRYLRVDMRRDVLAEDDDERRVTFTPYGFDWRRKLESMRRTAETLLDAASPSDEPAPRFEEGHAPPQWRHTGGSRPPPTEL
jgi:tRNA threonylcarbamoyladenosine biosynthesis protein TsaE